MPFKIVSLEVIKLGVKKLEKVKIRAEILRAQQPKKIVIRI